MEKNLLANAGDVGSMSELRRSPGREHGNPFQYSCLENAMDKGAWWVIVHGFAKSQIRLTEHAHTHTHTHTHNPRQMDLFGEKGIMCSDDSLSSTQSTVFRVPDNQSKAGSEPNLSCI